MKKTIITAVWLLAVLMLLGVISGCNAGGGETTEPPATSEEETTDAPSDETEKFVISKGGKCVCTVIRPDDASEDVIDLAVKVKKKLSDKTGLSIDIASDFIIPGKTHDPDKFEILIGSTNYDESSAAVAGMRYSDYSITMEGHKIIINGLSESTISKAVTWFCTTGIRNLAQNSDGDWELSFENYVFNGGYKVSSISVGDVPITEYTFVYGKSAGKVSQAAAESVAAVFAQATGYLLKVTDDKTAPSDHEILIGSTNRLEKMTSGLSDYAIYLDGTRIVLDCNGAMGADGAVRALYSEKLAAGGDIKLDNTLSVKGSWMTDEAIARAEGTDIRVMSYNILTEKWGGTDTAPRAERLGVMLKAYSPDIVGIQEVCGIWVKYIPIYVEGYSHVCLVRPDGGENYSTVLYKTDKYELVATGVIPYSKSQNLYCRNMGWAILKDKTTGKNVGIISTHWDFNSDSFDANAYRKVQAEELAAQVKKLAEKYNCPVFTTGDYNTGATSESMNYFRSINNMWCWKFDSKLLNNYGSASTLGTIPSVGGGVIDYVFGTKDTTPLQSFVVVNFDTKNISDHQPVVADVKLP